MEVKKALMTQSQMVSRSSGRFLELSCSERYEFSGRHCRLRWNHVSNFSKIKQKKRLDSMCYVIRGMPEGFVSSDSFCPEDGMRCCQPFPFPSIAYFHNGFPDI
jgi:hypothetical protein